MPNWVQHVGAGVVKEPIISVGLMAAKDTLHFNLTGSFTVREGSNLPAGDYTARSVGDGISVLDQTGRRVLESKILRILPERAEACRFSLRGVTVGIGFHWQQPMDLLFQGELHLYPTKKETIQAVNRLPLETYLSSVVASEMSETAPLEFLKAHAIISRGWALRVMEKRRRRPSTPQGPSNGHFDEKSILSWTGAEVHRGFDVCADDHCQRYRGILGEKAGNPARAVQETWGMVLTHGDEICDTRYSKCCGGMTEDFRTAWEDLDIPYLSALPDNDSFPEGYSLPLSVEKNAQNWVTHLPDAFCNTNEPSLLQAVLPTLDRATTNFYRWQVVYAQQEIRQIIGDKTGKNLGQIQYLLPLERGRSGRIIHLRIVGSKGTLTVGKELQIRRVLAPTHLYSSAFVIEKETEREGTPVRFRLIGAGWGHGVGLCQIGAAVMASRGKDNRQILQHYFPGTVLKQQYQK
jgi:SpoIID/LytB domain protein